MAAAALRAPTALVAEDEIDLREVQPGIYEGTYTIGASGDGFPAT